MSTQKKDILYIYNLSLTIAQQLRIPKHMGGITAEAARQIFTDYGRQIHNSMLAFKSETLGRIVSFGRGPFCPKEPEEIVVHDAIPQPLYTNQSGDNLLVEMATRVIAVKISEVLWKESLSRSVNVPAGARDREALGL
jgi:hypothetical protein